MRSDLTAKEVAQFVTLIKNYSKGLDTKPIDCRSLSKQTIVTARIAGMVEWRNTDGEFTWSKQPGGRLCYRQDLQFGYNFNAIPVEVLWVLVQPMIARSRGFQITHDPAWHDLNIDCLGDSWVKNNPSTQARAIEEITTVLGRLAICGYIYLQQGGNVWAISVIREEQSA